jgi:hypothetical protein
MRWEKRRTENRRGRSGKKRGDREKKKGRQW